MCVRGGGGGSVDILDQGAEALRYERRMKDQSESDGSTLKQGWSVRVCVWHI